MLRLLIVLIAIFLLHRSAFAQNKIHDDSVTVKQISQSLDSSRSSLLSKIDSRKKLNLPTDKLQHQLDSISRIDPLKVLKDKQTLLVAKEQKLSSLPAGVKSNVQQKLNSGQQIITDELPNVPAAKLPGVQVPGELQAPAVVTNANILTPPGTSVKLPDAEIPTAGIPDASLPTVNNPLGNTGIEKEISSISSVPQKEIGDLKKETNVGPVKELGELTKESQAIAGYKNDLTGIAKGDEKSTAALEKKIEKEAGNTSGIKTLTQQSQQLDQYKKLVKDSGDPQALKEQGTVELKKAVNHFAGKEDILKAAMEQMTPLKEKYTELNSMTDLPKRRPNPLHGKPFFERIVPALTFQVLHLNHQFQMDLYSSAGYRFTERITAGGGWKTRIRVSHYQLSNARKVYGPRLFADCYIKGGLALRAEVELMHTLIPPNQTTSNRDPQSEAWVCNSFAGLKKDYKIFKRLRGNAQILYNLSTLVGHHTINTYGDPITARIGLSWEKK